MHIGEIIHQGERELPEWKPDPNFIPEPVKTPPERKPAETPAKVTQI